MLLLMNECFEEEEEEQKEQEPQKQGTIFCQMLLLQPYDIFYDE